ncbi:MAG TPA: hypothetical protein VHS09_04005, partial [Polyangiaceae bacterium]|nr:hypothetical protein [Polyangiaceae bacterium]
MTRRRRALALTLSTTIAFAFAFAGVPVTALAQPAAPADAVRQEARDRFDRGLKLFNDGDNPGAL